MDVSQVPLVKRRWAEKARDQACDLLGIPRVPIIWHYALLTGKGGAVFDDLETAHREIHLALCDLTDEMVTREIVWHEIKHVHDLELGWHRGDHARMERRAEKFAWQAQYYINEE
jgi:hypothetical protein